MRYLGIDYGAKRVGIAISDESLNFAFPLKVLEAEKDLVSLIDDICKENKIEGIVVGESKNYNQKDNEIMKEVTPFVEKLKVTSGLPVYMHPEFMTSMEAEQIQGKNEMHDASSAALILKSYIDTINNKDK